MLRRKRAATRWTADPTLTELLDTHGGPFDSAAYRSAWCSTIPEWRDVSFGGRSSDLWAAVGLLARGSETAESIPFTYGGVIASRPLNAMQMQTFLEAAREEADVRELTVRSVPIRPTKHTSHVSGAVAGWTSVAYLSRSDSLEERLDAEARRLLRVAARAGASGRVSSDPSAFHALYSESAREHWLRYPDTFVSALATTEALRFYEVELEGRVVSSVAVLLGPRHWAAWLATQDANGRSISANYFAVTELLRNALSDGIRAVDLGISTGMPGVALFKRRFDSVLVPVLEQRVGS